MWRYRGILYIYGKPLCFRWGMREKERRWKNARKKEREREVEGEGGRTGGRWKAATRSWGASVLFLPCPRSSPVLPLHAAPRDDAGTGWRRELPPSLSSGVTRAKSPSWNLRRGRGRRRDARCIIIHAMHRRSTFREGRGYVFGKEIRDART